MADLISAGTWLGKPVDQDWAEDDRNDSAGVRAGGLATRAVSAIAADSIVGISLTQIDSRKSAIALRSHAGFAPPGFAPGKARGFFVGVALTWLFPFAWKPL